MAIRQLCRISLKTNNNCLSELVHTVAFAQNTHYFDRPHGPDQFLWLKSVFAMVSLCKKVVHGSFLLFLHQSGCCISADDDDKVVLYWQDKVDDACLIKQIKKLQLSFYYHWSLVTSHRIIITTCIIIIVFITITIISSTAHNTIKTLTKRHSDFCYSHSSANVHSLHTTKHISKITRTQKCL